MLPAMNFSKADALTSALARRNVPVVAQSAWSEAPCEICRSRTGC
jgi:hypothetical protein